MDPEFSKAAENIEIVRLYVKVLLDEQKKQQEQQEQEQEQQNDLVKKLKELIERQNALIGENEVLRAAKPNAADPATDEAWRKALTAMTGRQSTLRDDTGKVLVEMRQTVEQIRQQAAAGGSPGAAPGSAPQAPQADATGFAEKVEEASGHVGNAMIDEQLAQDELAATSQEPALVHQANAVKDLEEAVKALSEDQDQQQQQSDDQQQDQNQQDQEEQDQQDQQDQGDQQEQEQEDGEDQEDQQDQEPQDGEADPDQQEEEPEQRAAESAEDILDEEKENQKERQPARPGRIKPVDKDW